MNEMTPQAHDNRAKITEIRAKLHLGAITYEEARALARPVIQGINRRGAEIAKEHGVKFKPITFAALMR